MGANNITVQGTITTAAVAVLTCPSTFPDGYVFQMQSFNLVNDNTGGGDVIDAYLVKNGGTATAGVGGNKTFVNLSIADNTSYVGVSGDLHVLKSGDAVHLKADTGGKITYTITYTIETEVSL